MLPDNKSCPILLSRERPPDLEEIGGSGSWHDAKRKVRAIMRRMK
jgi:hypothetical protein